MKASITQMRIYYSLYDRLLDRRAMARAFEKVRRAQGAPGVDRQTIADFQSRLWEELDQLVTELRTRTYQPQPVRRVSIPPCSSSWGLMAAKGTWEFPLFVTASSSSYCWTSCNRFSILTFTRQAMVTDRAAAANRQWRKQRCSFGNMVASMWSIWIFRNALTGWIMT